MGKLTKGIRRFTVDLSIIGSIVRHPYTSKINPDCLVIRTKHGERISQIEYSCAADRDADYEELLKQWEAYECQRREVG